MTVILGPTPWLLLFVFLLLLKNCADKRSALQAELDRFCDTLISIRNEIADIEQGKADK